MTPDLHSTLDAIACRATAAAQPVPVDRLLQRLHTRRTVRALATTGLCAAAVAGVAVGALAVDGLWRDDDPPAPPATQTTTPRPTASPSPTSTPTPTETPDAFVPDWDACGTPFYADELAGHEADDGSWLWLENRDEVGLPADRPLPLDAAVLSTVDRGQVQARLVSAFMIQPDPVADGTFRVVAVPSVALDVSAAGTLTAAEGLPLPAVDVPFTSCAAAPAAGGDGALDRAADPAGSYRAVLVAEVTGADGTTTVVVTQVARLGAVSMATPSEPSFDVTPGRPLRIPTDVSYDSSDAPGIEYACGSQAWTWTQGERFEAPTVAIDGTAFRENGDLIVRARFTNAGDVPITGAWLDSIDVQVERGGRQIGAAKLYGSVSLPPVWAPGVTVEVELSAGPFTCTVMGGESWPAGSYALTVMTSVAGPETPADDLAGIGGGPFPFTLD